MRTGEGKQQWPDTLPCSMLQPWPPQGPKPAFERALPAPASPKRDQSDAEDDLELPSLAELGRELYFDDDLRSDPALAVPDFVSEVLGEAEEGSDDLLDDMDLDDEDFDLMS